MRQRIVNALNGALRSTCVLGCRASKIAMLLAASLVALSVLCFGFAHAEVIYSWTKTMGGIGNDTGYSVRVDSTENIYVTGYFRNTVDFDPGAGIDNHTSAGAEDSFLTKINSGGTYAWTKTMGGTGIDYGLSVGLDSTGNVYMTGYFHDTVDFDPGAGIDNHTSAGGRDIFLVKINSDGTYGWTKTMGGTGSDYGWSVTVYSNGICYVTGGFSDTVDFDPGAGIDNHTSLGDLDIFLTKINSDGTYVWTETMGGTGPDVGYSVTVDSTGISYVTGNFSDTVDFDPGAGIDNHTSAGGLDIFLSKFTMESASTPASSSGSGCFIGSAVSGSYR